MFDYSGCENNIYFGTEGATRTDDRKQGNGKIAYPIIGRFSSTLS